MSKPAYLVGVYRHPSREAAERADRMCAPSHEAESADTEIHDTPPVVLAGLVRGGEYATVDEWEAGSEDICVDARGRIASDYDILDGKATFPLTWYRYPEEP